MADVKIYLKPRPISRMHDHSNYLPFKRKDYCKYGPFFADYGAVPSDATEVHTLQSPTLSTALSALYNVSIPSLDTEVPDPNKSGVSAWLDFLKLATVKVDLSLVHGLSVRITSFNSPKVIVMPWLFTLLRRKALTAASAFASTFIADAFVDDTAPPLLPSSPNNESSATDSMSSFHAGDLDDDATMSALNHPFEPLRRRKRIIISELANQ
ncbi:hypothetical protein EDD85DRAFT_1025212 [Armillaria nabsnona]|nr:hypothetical protein EDD85DRAFT_1025212 [Armillaria nabsnona]